MKRSKILLLARLVLVVALLVGGAWAVGKYALTPQKAEALLWDPCVSDADCDISEYCVNGSCESSTICCGNCDENQVCPLGMSCTNCPPLQEGRCYCAPTGGGDPWWPTPSESVSPPPDCSGCTIGPNGEMLGDCSSECAGQQCYQIQAGITVPIPCTTVHCSMGTPAFCSCIYDCAWGLDCIVNPNVYPFDPGFCGFSGPFPEPSISDITVYP